MITCPSCKKKWYYGVATFCDCGYVFSGPQTQQIPVLASIDRSLRTIKTILVWWFVLAAILVALFLTARIQGTL